MATVVFSPIGGAGTQFFDNNGDPLNGGKLYTYEAGGTTPAVTYTTYAGSVQQANPIVLDTYGRVTTSGTWLVSGTSYKFVLKNAAGDTIATWDHVTGATDSAITTAAYAVLAANIVDINTNIDDIAGCYVKAKRITSDQTLTASTETTVIYNSEITDSGSDYNPTTGTFTAPATGRYLITVAAIMFPSSAPTISENILLYAMINGTGYNNIGMILVEDVTVAARTITGSIVLLLTASDLVTILADNNSGVNWSLQALANFHLTITRIS